MKCTNLTAKVLDFPKKKLFATSECDSDGAKNAKKCQICSNILFWGAENHSKLSGIIEKAKKLR